MATTPSPKSSPPANAQQQDPLSQPQSTTFANAIPPHMVERQKEARRPSVQFSTPGQVPGSSFKQPPIKQQGRISSPPPPPVFRNRVSFDTFDNRDATDFSLTLNTKHKDYHYSRRSRIFLCGLNKDEYSEYALEWLIDELVDDGDEIVCLRVVEKESKITSESSIQQHKYAKEARKMLDWVIEKNHEEKAVSLVLEFAVGQIKDVIQRMVQVYEPAILIVGTRGKSLGGIQGLLPGSVSKYCLQNSPVPVIVVRPSEKREKKKTKRQKRPDRGSYLDILERSGTGGSHVLDRANRDSIVPEMPAASEKEAEAVAEAIGISSAYESKTGARMSRIHSTRGDISEDEDDPKSPGVVLKSPVLGTLESPAVSDSEDESDDERNNGLEAVPGSMLATHDVASDDELDKPAAAAAAALGTKTVDAS